MDAPPWLSSFHLSRVARAPCPLAEEDAFGFFAPTDIGGPLSRIVHKPCKTATFARHLERLSSKARGAVLQRHGGTGAARYRFVNPLLQPCVVMRGLSEGVDRAGDSSPADRGARAAVLGTRGRSRPAA